MFEVAKFNFVFDQSYEYRVWLCVCQMHSQLYSGYSIIVLDEEKVT